MNSVSRAGLTIAGLVTAAVVGGVFFVQGFTAARESAATASDTPVVTVAPTLAPTDSPSPNVVYINPVPSPSVINIIQTPPPAPPAAAKPPVIHVVVPTVGGDDDGNDD
jgi:hypothetical protein